MQPDGSVTGSAIERIAPWAYAAFASGTFSPEHRKFHMYKLLISLLLALASSSAISEPTTTQLQLGRELANLMRVQAMFDSYLQQCTASSGAAAFDPKTAFSADPGSFGGLSPQSTYWPEVEAIYRAYQKETCAYITSEAFLSFYATKYAESTSETDLRTAIAFYSSPVGKRLQESSVRVNDAFQVYANERLGAAYRTAYKRVHVDLRELMRKYQREPK